MGAREKRATYAFGFGALMQLLQQLLVIFYFTGWNGVRRLSGTWASPQNILLVFNSEHCDRFQVLRRLEMSSTPMMALWDHVFMDFGALMYCFSWISR